MYYVHDEGWYLPEECAVSSYGTPFDKACDEIVVIHDFSLIFVGSFQQSFLTDFLVDMTIRTEGEYSPILSC